MTPGAAKWREAILIARASIKRHEGLSLAPYRDHLGNLTIGRGHRIERPCAPITRAQADKFLEADLETALQATIRQYTSHQNLSPTRRAVLIEMAFQMGPRGLASFRRMRGAMDQGLFELAADEMTNSTWRSQTPDRCADLAARMRVG